MDSKRSLQKLILNDQRNNKKRNLIQMMNTSRDIESASVDKNLRKKAQIVILEEDTINMSIDSKEMEIADSKRPIKKTMNFQDEVAFMM